MGKASVRGGRKLRAGGHHSQLGRTQEDFMEEGAFAPGVIEWEGF